MNTKQEIIIKREALKSATEHFQTALNSGKSSRILSIRIKKVNALIAEIAELEEKLKQEETNIVEDNGYVLSERDGVLNVTNEELKLDATYFFSERLGGYLRGMCQIENRHMKDDTYSRERNGTSGWIKNGRGAIAKADMLIIEEMEQFILKNARNLKADFLKIC